MDVVNCGAVVASAAVPLGVNEAVETLSESSDKSLESAVSSDESAASLSERGIPWPSDGAGTLEDVRVWSPASGVGVGAGSGAGSEEWPWVGGVEDLCSEDSTASLRRSSWLCPSSGTGIS